MNRRRNIRTQTEQELAELEAAEQNNQQIPPKADKAEEHQPVPTYIPPIPAMSIPAPVQEEVPETSEESRTHLVKHRAPRAEAEEEMFENVYRRDTYYIDRAYVKPLKKLIKDTQKTKTHLMNEALELLFKQYEIE